MVTAARRATSRSAGDAYRALLGDRDPASLWSTAHDLRPGGTADGSGPMVVSGPDDLRELRNAVERVTGPGSWPGPSVDMERVVERRTVAVAVERPADLVAIVVACADEIDDRSPWRTWRTALELIGSGVAELESVTVDCVLISDV